jgi:hypothetical protein
VIPAAYGIYYKFTSLSVAVHSTHIHGALPGNIYYSLMDKEKYPLAGLRRPCKDLFDIKGLVISGGSREMLRLYSDPQNETAPSIQTLSDLGAVC